MPFNRRSKAVTQGHARAPNRAMFYAMGYADQDFDKPMVGIANGHSTITPCNAGLNGLAERAEAAVREAGAMPRPSVRLPFLMPFPWAPRE